MKRERVNAILKTQAAKGSHEAKVLLAYRSKFATNAEQMADQVRRVNEWAAQFGLKMEV